MASFEFYSPDSQHGLWFQPNSGAGAMRDMGTVDRDPRRALQSQFLDLPTAVEVLRQRGMRAKEIKEAQLQWSSGPACGSFAATNALLPPCGNTPRFQGVQWMITSQLGEPEFVPAVAR